MTLEYFWNVIDSYCKKEEIGYTTLSLRMDFSPSYFNGLKKRKRLPTPHKMFELRELFTDDEIFDVMIKDDSATIDLDDYIMELNVSKEMKLKNRQKRKVYRDYVRL